MSIKYTPEELAALKVLQKFLKNNMAEQILADGFQLQRDFIKHPGRLKALLASRRFGKSRVACMYLLMTVLSKPSSYCLFIGLSRDSVAPIIDQHFLILLDKYKIEYDLNKTSLTFTFPNKSKVRFLGANNSDTESDKFKGAHYSLCIIDEAQDFSNADLRKLVYSSLKPACIDKQGTIVMVGTPADLVQSDDPKKLPLFYAVTTEQEYRYRWKVFKGDTRLNPHMRENFEKEIADALEFDPHFKDSPEYKREYLGEWVIDHDRTVYKFLAEKDGRSHNIIDKLPELEIPGDSYTYIMGLDFGFRDAQAFVIWAYSQYDPHLYCVYSFKQTGMTVDAIEDKLKELKEKFPYNKIMCDHSVMIIETMRKRLHFNFINAKKIKKFEHISLMNNDLYNGTIKLLPGTDSLKMEWNSLIWDNTQATPVELATCENHCADAALYSYREAKNYLASKKPIIYAKDSGEAFKQKVMKSIARKHNQEQMATQLTQAEIDFGDIK